MSFLEGKIYYKNYLIQPSIVCFDIRYFVFGEGFSCESYKTINEAQKAIDKYIAKKYINNMFDIVSEEIEINKNLILESLKEIILE